MRKRKSKHGYLFIVDNPYYKSEYYRTAEERDEAVRQYYKKIEEQIASYQKARLELNEVLFG